MSQAERQQQGEQHRSDCDCGREQDRVHCGAPEFVVDGHILMSRTKLSMAFAKIIFNR
jgi:hypothetical protein